jgi:DNA polymerase-3 subunit epsilon
MGKYTAVVIDFETTGLSPNYGDRTIEVGAVLIKNNKVLERFQSLMNPEKKINSFIEDFTGITNKMLTKAPKIKDVMVKLKKFIANHHLIAHNASFDIRFLDSELIQIGHKRKNEFACSMLAARRLYPKAPNHKLETLIKFKSLQTKGDFHRALADADATVQLWVEMNQEIKQNFGLKIVPFTLLQRLGKVPVKKVPDFIRKHVYVSG